MTPQKAYWIAHEAGKRLPELEDIIMISSWHSYLYSANIIKGRWVEAEDVIMESAYFSLRYAVNIIKGKLPDKMHNMMILYAIKNPMDISVKLYFEQF